MKKIIVNADDFGLSKKINQGIVQAAEAGILQNASIIANGEAVEDAMESGKSLSLGIHLTLVFGKPVADTNMIESLLFKDKSFARGYPEFTLRYLTAGVKLSEIEYEFEAQREVLSAVAIDHLDCHQHLHLLPGIFDLIMKLAEKWGIKFVRVPYENFEIGIRGKSLLPSDALNLASWGKKRKLQALGLQTTDNFFGSSFTGELTLNVWKKLLPAIPSGLTEIMCHPGLDDTDISNNYGWKSQWEEELRALTDPTLKKIAKKEGIIFTTFKEIAENLE